MGQIFRSANKYLKQVNQDSVLVEIGSDRWEGSTEYFANLAKENNTVLHTVDVDATIQPRLNYLENVVWHCESGSQWTKNFSTHNKKIACLYLDNFDYIWDINEVGNQMIDQQKIIYKDQYCIDLTNQNCQVEHLTQMIDLLPFMDKTGIIIFDDTYTYNDCWIGKGGPAVVFLLANGYHVLEVNPQDHGVILGKI